MHDSSAIPNREVHAILHVTTQAKVQSPITAMYLLSKTKHFWCQTSAVFP